MTDNKSNSPEEKENKEKPISGIERFLIWCAGIPPEAIKPYKMERLRFSASGLLVLLTAIFAVLSGSYALHFVFNEVYPAIAIGIIWGLFILTIDRLLLMGLYRYKGRHLWKQGLPRLALAAVIAITVAKPMELKLFAAEIETESAVLKREVIKERTADIDSAYAKYENRIDSILVAGDTELKRLESLRNELREEARREADGTGGSGKVSPGPIYRIKKQQADEAQSELEAFRSDFESTKDSLNSYRVALQNQKQSELEDYLSNFQSGLILKFQALEAVLKRYPEQKLVHYFIILLFLVIETAPLTMKLLMPTGPWEHLIRNEEEEIIEKINLRYSTA
ncbi:DUF4407 domain-containing protein [Mangrovivirga cuniculi]|uniref:DUF4407 domain-containing protein n=1 Tax=Mangrovivirga cuniculi TaxID=2715131 RepID=A0A4D7K1D9_9BACT|nr:DUF4407 domain-containing protein [Mangrovivirga cuniculi]QCK13268.1 hypothetical protein DCC35_00120 [Mangrovivirga cuniculi]